MIKLMLKVQTIQISSSPKLQNKDALGKRKSVKLSFKKLTIPYKNDKSICIRVDNVFQRSLE